jgi:hypothetical protein
VSLKQNRTLTAFLTAVYVKECKNKMVTFDKCSDYAHVAVNGVEVGIFFLGKYPYFIPFKNDCLFLDTMKDIVKLGEDFIKEREKSPSAP